MPVICVLAAVWSAGGGEEEAARRLLEAGVVPRVAVEGGRLWVDGRGAPVEQVLPALRSALGEGIVVRCGVAETPVAACAAAVTSGEGATMVVPSGTDREFLAALPLSLLRPADHLSALLEGVGVLTCGQLASLAAEAVEVRFGADAVALWRLSRAEDPRRLFRPIPAERPHASIDFIDYVVTNPEQLLFAAHALLGNVCGTLAERGEHARSIRIDLPLANGQRWSRALRPARPSASRAVWLRLARSVLERLTVADAVAGVELYVQATEAAATLQGDLFDTGFATSAAVEAALARLLETLGPVIVRSDVGEHPLPERSTGFVPLELDQVGAASGTVARPDAAEQDAMAFTAGLTLQLLPEPRPVLVESVQRRDHNVPIRFRDDRWRQLATVAGPDRLSGGIWDETYAREYFRGVTGEGMLVLLYHDAREDAWYLHGWWD